MRIIFLLLPALLIFQLSSAQDVIPENTHIIIIKQKIIKYGKPNEVSLEYKTYTMTDEAWANFKEDGLKNDLASYGDNILEGTSGAFSNLSASVMTPPPPKEVPIDGYYYMDYVASSGNCYVIYKNKEYEKRGEEIICKVTKKGNLEKLLSQVQNKNKRFDSLIEQECIE